MANQTYQFKDANGVTYFVNTANTNTGLSAGVPLTFTQDISSISNQAFTLGQQLAAASLPVVLTAAQIATLTPPTSVGITGTPTVVNAAGTNLMGKVGIDQTTQGTTNFVTSNITQVGGSSLSLGQQLAAASVPVVLTAAQLASLTTPTVSIAANQTVGLAAGSAKIGIVTTDQTTHGTTDLVAADITKVAGSSIATGHGTASGAIRVELPTDGTGVVVLGAGSAAIGTVTTNADGSLSGGTAGSKSIAAGGVYNTSLPTLTNGQQAGIQLDSSGRQWVNVSNSTIAVTGTFWQSTQNVQNVVGTTGGATSYNYICTAASNQDATVVKASAGTLYALEVGNIGSSAAWLKLYNSSSSPTSASTPYKVILIPANSTAANGAGNNISFGPQGIAFSSGISFRVSTGIANNDATAVTTNTVLVNLDYN